MKRLIATLLIVAMCLLPASSLARETEARFDSIHAGYRAMQTSGALAITEAGDAVTHTFNDFGAATGSLSGVVGNVADYFEIYFKSTTGTGPLHVQLFKHSDADSMHCAPSSVFLIYPDATKPFYIQGINEVKFDVTEASQVGIVVIDYYKM